MHFRSRRIIPSDITQSEGGAPPSDIPTTTSVTSRLLNSDTTSLLIFPASDVVKWVQETTGVMVIGVGSEVSPITNWADPSVGFMGFTSDGGSSVRLLSQALPTLNEVGVEYSVQYNDGMLVVCVRGTVYNIKSSTTVANPVIILGGAGVGTVAPTVSTDVVSK